MIFKKGIKVEVLENWKVPFGSWRPARILSGNGRSYVVKYDSCSLETPAVMNKVPRRALRPCPPPVEARSWACGDVVEVFDDDSWKLAEVMRTLGWNIVVARLLGSSKEIEAPFCQLRMPQTWKDNHWIASQKDSVKCKKALVNNQSKKVSFQIPLSSIEVQKCGRVDRFAEVYDDCVDQWCQESFGRLKKRSRLCGPPAYALAGACGKKKHITKKLTGQLLEKVDDVDSPKKNYSEKRMNTAINHETVEFCGNGISIANASSNLVVSLYLSDNECTTASVGSCSVINGSCRSVHSMASPRQKLCGHPDDAESYCGSPAETSHSRKDDMPKVIHDLELDAYRATMRSLFASGSLSWEQESLLTDLRLALNISDDEHLSELKDLMPTRS